MEPEVIDEEVSLFGNDDNPIKDVEVAAPVVDEKPSFEVPDKFKGKDIEDVITSYVNLEKEYGTKSNEVGELRKLTDQILMNQAQQPQQRAAEADINEEVSFDEFIDDADSAVDKVLQRNPRLQQLEQSLEQQATELSRKALLSRHEDADAVVATPEFQVWLAESPSRMRMLQEAHVKRDVDTASDLLDMYKVTRKVATEEAITERDAGAKEDLRRATVEKGHAPASTRKV